MLWKVYIPKGLKSRKDSNLLVGWIDNVNHNFIISSLIQDPIPFTNNDNKRNRLIQRIKSMNKTNNRKQSNFKCAVIGSTNITHDCSDLMRIYQSNAWAQFDKNYTLQKVLVMHNILNQHPDFVNNFYLIQYDSIDPSSVFSPYYSIQNDSSYDEVLKLFNESHSLLKQSRNKSNAGPSSSSSSCFVHMLSKYFKCINIIYGLLYASIVYIPPLLILSDCRIASELTQNIKKFGHIIKYLDKRENESSSSLDGIDNQRRHILNIWSNIINHFINHFIGVLFAYFLFFHIHEQLQFISEYLKFFDYDSICHHIQYLMGIPIGLKLNANLNDVFGKLSLFCLEILHIQIPHQLNLSTSNSSNFLTIWSVFDDQFKVQCNEANESNLHSLSSVILIYLPLIRIYLCALSCCFGITFIIAMISDIVSFLSLPFEILHRFFLFGYYLEARMLSICSKLFRGLKCNQLKHKVDECVLDTDQLFIGIILFAIFTFLLPTIVVYFIYFSVSMLYVWTFQLVLDVLQLTMHYLAIAPMIILLVKPKCLCQGFDVDIDIEKNKMVRINAKSFGALQYFKDSVKREIFERIDKDIKHKKFVQSLKIEMY